MAEVQRLRALGAKRGDPQDRGLPHARAGHGHPLVLRGQDRPPHHRRRAGRHRHEPLAHDVRVGGCPPCICTAWPMSCAAAWPPAAAGVPDIAFAGGFSAEDHIFKALALGAPFVKAVCMGRALMIPGMVGKNIGRWLEGQDGGPAQHGEPLRLQQAGDLRVLRGAQGEVRGRGGGLPPGGHRHLHRLPEAPGGPAAAHGRGPQVAGETSSSAATWPR